MSVSRIVVDTNVFAAGFTSSVGSNREVIRRCLAGRVHPLMSSALFHEYESVLTRASVLARCPLKQDERDQLLDAFLQACDWIRISFLWRPNLADESDNHVMELAVAGGATAVVTNNVRDFRGGDLVFPDIRVLTPARFLKSLEKTR